MTPNQKALSQKLGWIDSAKGIGIMFVVIGHAWRGLQTSDLISDTALFHVIDKAIYAFQMPYFSIRYSDRAGTAWILSYRFWSISGSFKRCL
jgi:uncharacterized membrane protein YcfT